MPLRTPIVKRDLQALATGILYIYTSYLCLAG